MIAFQSDFQHILLFEQAKVPWCPSLCTVSLKIQVVMLLLCDHLTTQRIDFYLYNIHSGIINNSQPLPLLFSKWSESKGLPMIMTSLLTTVSIAYIFDISNGN